MNAYENRTPISSGLMSFALDCMILLHPRLSSNMSPKISPFVIFSVFHIKYRIGTMANRICDGDEIYCSCLGFFKITFKRINAADTEPKDFI